MVLILFGLVEVLFNNSLVFFDNEYYKLCLTLKNVKVLNFRVFSLSRHKTLTAGNFGTTIAMDL